MARPREFDTETTLRRVTQIFWAKGFDKTSFRDLERATGLKKASLFAAYGDKRTLFLKALQQYQEDSYRLLEEVCTKTCSPRRSIQEWLFDAAGISQSECLGCFAVNTVVEMAPHDVRCARILELHHKRVEGLLASLITKGRKVSEFNRKIDPQVTARFLLCLVSGLQAISRAPGYNRQSGKQTRKLIELALCALE